GFVSSSVVRWNDASRPTTFVSATQLAAAIPSSDIATAGTVPVTVFSPAPGGGSTVPLTFAVQNPAPSIASLSPSSGLAASPGLTLIVNGGNYQPSSVVRWNGADRPTAFVSATRLQASISAADLASGAAVLVTVFTPGPGGGKSSALTFSVKNPV